MIETTNETISEVLNLAGFIPQLAPDHLGVLVYPGNKKFKLNINGVSNALALSNLEPMTYKVDFSELYGLPYVSVTQ